MRNIIRFKIHYGGSLQYRMGMRDIVNQSMRQRNELSKTFNLNKSKFITNEQEIVLILDKLLKDITRGNEALSSEKYNYLNQESFRNRKKEELNLHFDNLDKSIKGKKFNLIKNTLIDQNQNINQINKYFSQEEISILQMSNCVGLKLLEVIFNSYRNKPSLTYIDEHILEKIYNLCAPFKNELLLFENYNLYNPNNNMFDIVKSFFDSKENIVYNQNSNLSKDEFDLI